MFCCCRSYNYTAVANTPGQQVNTVRLGRDDRNLTNNVDSKTVTVLGTCNSPFGNTTKLTCSDGKQLNATASNNAITGPGQFDAVCCVSVSCFLLTHMLQNMPHPVS